MLLENCFLRKTSKLLLRNLHALGQTSYFHLTTMILLEKSTLLLKKPPNFGWRSLQYSVEETSKILTEKLLKKKLASFLCSHASVEMLLCFWEEACKLMRRRFHASEKKFSSFRIEDPKLLTENLLKKKLASFWRRIFQASDGEAAMLLWRYVHVFEKSTSLWEMLLMKNLPCFWLEAFKLLVDKLQSFWWRSCQCFWGKASMVLRKKIHASE